MMSKEMQFQLKFFLVGLLLRTFSYTDPPLLCELSEQLAHSQNDLEYFSSVPE